MIWATKCALEPMHALVYVQVDARSSAGRSAAAVILAHAITLHRIRASSHIGEVQILHLKSSEVLQALQCLEASWT